MLLFPQYLGLGETASVAVITGMKTWGANNGGYSNNQSRLIDLVLKASNTDPTTNSWTGTTIGTIAQFSNTWATNAKQTLGNANSTRYRYVWCELTITSADISYFCEIEFYQTLNGVETAINPASYTKIYDVFNANQSALFDGNTNQSTASCAYGPSASVYRAGLDLGA